MRDILIDLYVATFGRAPDPEGIQYWQDMHDSGELDLAGIASNMMMSQEAQERFPDGVDNDELVSIIYENLFDREPDEEGLNYWVDEMQSGDMTREMAIAYIVEGARADTGDPDDADMINDRTETARQYLERVEEGLVEFDETEAEKIIREITRPSDDSAELTIQSIEVTPEELEPGEVFTVDVNIEELAGVETENLFVNLGIAYVGIEDFIEVDSLQGAETTVAFKNMVIDEDGEYTIDVTADADNAEQVQESKAFEIIESKSDKAINVWEGLEYFDPDTSQTGDPDPPDVVEDWQWEEEYLEYDHDSYDVYSKEMYGVEVIVPIHEKANWRGEEKEGYANLIFNSFARFWEIFQGYRYDEYRVVVDDDTWGGAAGFGYVDAYLFDMEGMSPGTPSHSVFHAWNLDVGGGINSGYENRDRETWFVEGPTTYYELRADVLYAEDSPRTLEELDADFDLGGWLSYYKEEMLETGDDVPLLELAEEYNHHETKFMHVYTKSTLFSYLMDEKLNEHGSSLDHLMREMYHRFDYGHENYRAEDVQDIFKELTGGNSGDLFEKYVFGDEPLPLDKDYDTFFQNTLDEPFVDLQGVNEPSEQIAMESA